MDRVAAEVAEEIPVVLQHDHVDAGPGHEQAEHHAGRAATDDATPGLQNLPWHSRRLARAGVSRGHFGRTRWSALVAWGVTGANLLNQPETLLPPEPEVIAALRRTGRQDIAAVVAAHPTSSLAWASLAESVHGGDRPLESYAYARVGYHRGLDSLRKAGWRGQGPIPWSHEPNRGVLRALYALRRAAGEIGETDEAVRLTTFLNDADPTAISRIEHEHTLAADRAADQAADSSVDPAPPTEAFVIRGDN